MPEAGGAAVSRYLQITRVVGDGSEDCCRNHEGEAEAEQAIAQEIDASLAFEAVPKKSPDRKNMSDMKKTSLKATKAVRGFHRAESTTGKAVHQWGWGTSEVGGGGA